MKKLVFFVFVLILLTTSVYAFSIKDTLTSFSIKDFLYNLFHKDVVGVNIMEENTVKPIESVSKNLILSPIKEQTAENAENYQQDIEDVNQPQQNQIIIQQSTTMTDEISNMYKGIILDENNNPLEGEFVITFKIFNDLESNVVLYEETQGLNIIEGYLNFDFQQSANLEVLDSKEKYISIEIDNKRKTDKISFTVGQKGNILSFRLLSYQEEGSYSLNQISPQSFYWSWENPKPQGNALMDSDFLSSGKGWMVGYYGTIMFFNGTNWTVQYITPQYKHLRGVVAISEQDVWAVGDDGYMYHYNGSWSSIPRVITSSLYSISALSTNNIWVGAQNGVVLHYNGQSWIQIPTPFIGSMVWGMGIVSESMVWAFSNGNFWLYNSQTQQWIQYDTPLTVVGGFYVISPNDIWAVGIMTYGNLYVTHFDGSSWQSPIPLANGGTYLTSIDGSGSNIFVMYSSQENPIFYFDGYGWNSFSTPPINGFASTYITLSVQNSNIFYVGGQEGSLARYNNNWNVFSTNPNQKGALFDIFALDSNHIWAVGQGIIPSQVMTYNANTNSWSSDLVNIWTMHDVHASSPTNVWAVSPFDDTVIRNIGDGWETLSFGPSTAGFYGVRAFSNNDVWFVGSNNNEWSGTGLIYHYNGINFQQYQGSFPNAFLSLDISPTNKLYAGTSNGKIFFYNGLNWSEFSDPPGTGAITELAVRNDNDIWASVYYYAQPNLVVHYNGQQWEVIIGGPSNSTNQINGLDVSKDSVFVTQSNFCYVFVHNNNQWVQSPERFQTFFNVNTVSNNEFFISGPINDGILRGNIQKIPYTTIQIFNMTS